jgi:PPOX class probable F420-dependent enzyme
MSPRLNISMAAQDVRDLLGLPLPAVLTTLGPGGWPHSAGMWFVLDGEELLMWTYRKSQKAVNAARDPRCAFLLEHGRPYVDLRGVLVRGRLRLVGDRSQIVAIGRRLYERYLEASTGVAYESGPQQEIERQAEKRVGLVLPLERVATWDHAKMGIPPERMQASSDRETEE